MPKPPVPTITEAEVYELQMPGSIVGKEVIDGSARRIGIVRSLRITLPPCKVELEVKGLGVELPVDVSNITAVGNVIQLSNTIREAEEITIEDVQRLREETWKEVQGLVIR
jgi:sporulation protein YlmC with PRC-barrel domain